MNTLIDIYNNILKYNDKKIYVIVDDNDVPWFSASNVAKILLYHDTDDAIRRHVDDNDKNTFDKLATFMRNKPPYMKPNSIYINESGLYSLLVSSQMPKAKIFKKWITSEVLPSIRKTGSYHIEEKYKNELDELNDEFNKLKVKFKDAKKQIRILRHNQKKKHYKKTGLIYILRPIDTSNKKLLKLGKTTDFNKRLNAYNTSVPDNMLTLFELQVDDPDAVEHCIKGLMHKYIYRPPKEYYECSLGKLKHAIYKCDNLVHDEYYCDKCQSRVKSLNHFYDEYNINDDDKLYLDLVVNQTGGHVINNDVLAEIDINDLNKLEKYCQVHLEPHFDHRNIPFYQCPIHNLIKIFNVCNEVIDNSLINEIIMKYNLVESDTILIDIPSDFNVINQSGGDKTIPKQKSSNEFNKNIIVLEDRNILPNGIILHHNGKIEYTNNYRGNR